MSSVWRYDDPPDSNGYSIYGAFVDLIAIKFGRDIRQHAGYGYIQFYHAVWDAESEMWQCIQENVGEVTKYTPRYEDKQLLCWRLIDRVV